MNHDPVELSPDRVRTLNLSKGKLFLGGIWGTVESGQTWLATDGKRSVISADSMTVIYVLTGATQPVRNNRFFIQSSTGFRGEVTTYPMIEAARRAAPMARLAELEMQVMIGIFAASSGVGLATVIGTDIVDFCIKNQDDFGKWGKALAACVAVREVLKRHAPTLYDRLIEGVLVAAGAGVLESLRNVPAAAGNDPKLIGRFIGALVGKLGKKALSSRLSALSVIWILLSTAATKSLSAVPRALRMSLDERAKAAEAIITELRRSGVTISAEDARKIVEEVAAKADEIRASLDQLKSAFEGIRAE
jgi:hypothetical protein